MMDHLSLTVVNYLGSRAFYAAALAPLGARIVQEVGATAGFGVGTKPTFWIIQGPADFWHAGHRPGAAPLHIAFAASSRLVVDAFYQAALAAGGVSHGAPGLRPAYHSTYYAAFVLDPDGNNIEVVCHEAAL